MSQRCGAAPCLNPGPARPPITPCRPPWWRLARAGVCGRPRAFCGCPRRPHALLFARARRHHFERGEDPTRTRHAASAAPTTPSPRSDDGAWTSPTLHPSPITHISLTTHIHPHNPFPPPPPAPLVIPTPLHPGATPHTAARGPSYDGVASLWLYSVRDFRFLRVVFVERPWWSPSMPRRIPVSGVSTGGCLGGRVTPVNSPYCGTQPCLHSGVAL